MVDVVLVMAFTVAAAAGELVGLESVLRRPLLPRT
jgi:hypothetical protein